MAGEGTLILKPDAAGIARAAELLRAGQLVALPTETVYGLAARADSGEAVAGIYRAKGRPEFNPLIVHIASLEQAAALAELDERAEKLAAHFWPGPLTMVLPARAGSGIAPAVSAGLPTLALRMPDHPVMRRVLMEVALPLAAPSANPSGRVSPTTAEHVAQSLGTAVAAVLDGGACARGLESTIVALRPAGAWQLLRPGPIAEAEIAALLGPAHPLEHVSIEAPGQMVRHYSPGKPVRLDAEAPAPDEFAIGFGAVAGHCSLSEEGDLALAAARLYACLRQAAASDKPRIAVAPIPREGIGVAINDRLKRAAA